MGNCQNQCLTKKNNLMFEVEKSKIIAEQKQEQIENIIKDKENSM